VGLGEELRRIWHSNVGRLRLLRRLLLLAGLIGAIGFLSTLDFGPSASSDSFEGEYVLGFIVWVLVFFAGTELVVWLRGEGRRIASERTTDWEGAGAAPEDAPRFPGPNFGLWLDTPPGRFVAGIAVLLLLLLPAGWWGSAAPALRTVLEALPLGGAVAVRPAQDGDPLLVAALALAFLGLAIWAASRWRRSSVREYLYGGNTFVGAYSVGMIRTVVIFGGLALVPNLAYIAHGTDLREDPVNTFTGPVWPLIVVTAWGIYTFVTLRRVYDREIERPPSRG
jgi:hypothetical protein